MTSVCRDVDQQQSMAEHAAALLEAGRLHEIVGVRPGATREEVKKACQAARLRTHPDKRGGDAALFRVVEDAVKKLLLYLRDDYRERYRQCVEMEQALAAKERKREEARVAREREMEERARRVHVELSRARDALRRRCTRGTSTRFPTLPRCDVGARVRTDFASLRTRYRKLGQTRSRYAKEGRDVADLVREMCDIMAQARCVVDTAVASCCEDRGICVLFPHLPRTHAKYSALDGLRLASRRISDRIRKAPVGNRQDLEDERDRIAQEAWAIVQSPVSDPDRIDTVVL